MIMNLEIYTKANLNNQMKEQIGNISEHTKTQNFCHKHTISKIITVLMHLNKATMTKINPKKKIMCNGGKKVSQKNIKQ